MSMMASQITTLAIVYSTVYSVAGQRKHQSSASLAFVMGIHRWPVNFPHKGRVTRKMFPFHDVIMCSCFIHFFIGFVWFHIFHLCGSCADSKVMVLFYFVVILVLNVGFIWVPMFVGLFYLHWADLSTVPAKYTWNIGVKSFGTYAILWRYAVYHLLHPKIAAIGTPIMFNS